MENWLKISILAALVVGMVSMSGCTDTGSKIPLPQATATQTPTSVTTMIPIVLAPATTQTSQIQTPVPAITTTSVPVSQITLIHGDNPYLNNLQIKKNYFATDINNCPMQEAFPAIAKDPNYGIKHPVPKIMGISDGEYRVFLRDFTEGKNENTKMIGVSRCEGAVIDPRWNFVEVRAKVTPTNGRPANYSVSLNVRSQGKVIAQFKTIELLTLDQIIEFVSYIPLKTNEMDLFDSVEITYTKLQN